MERMHLFGHCVGSHGCESVDNFRVCVLSRYGPASGLLGDFQVLKLCRECRSYVINAAKVKNRRLLLFALNDFNLIFSLMVISTEWPLS
jgi:hypothetical protein